MSSLVDSVKVAGVGSNQFDVYLFAVDCSYFDGRYSACVWLPGSGISGVRGGGLADTKGAAVAEALRQWGEMMSLAVDTAADALDSGELEIRPGGSGR